MFTLSASLLNMVSLVCLEEVGGVGERKMEREREEMNDFFISHVVGALPRSYENVKEVRELFGVLFKQELTVDVDGFIRESDLHDLPSGTTKDTIDRTSLLAGIEKFARYGPSGPIEWLEDVGTDELADPYISNPCKMAIVNVSIEVIMVVLGALGMPSAAKVAKKVMNGIPVSRLVGLELSIQALKTAQTVAHKAQYVTSSSSSFSPTPLSLKMLMTLTAP